MGRAWYVTGSSRGLGHAITVAALEAGDSVIATARNPAQLRSLVEKYGSNILPLAVDVTNPADVAKAVETGHFKFGRLDIIVSNADYANTASFEDMDMFGLPPTVRDELLRRHKRLKCRRSHSKLHLE